MKKWVVIAAWLIAAAVAFPFQSELQVLASDESDAFKDRGAESTRVDELIDTRFEGGNETTAVIVYERPEPERALADGVRMCERIPDVARIITAYQGVCGELPAISPPQSSPITPFGNDGTTNLTTVWTRDDATESVVRDVAVMREIRPDWAYVTGEAAFAADQAEALAGIDETLLVATLILVLVLLLIIYRSPTIALVPLLVVGIAYLVAAGVVYAGARAGLYQATGQATAILIVLMFGAGTDYCLLLLARYREELATNAPDPMGTALRRTAPAIVSAGGIVVVAMLVLSLADYNATRWMGPVLAIGTAITVLAGVTLLPAVLSVLPHKAFTHKQPIGAIWPRIGALVRRRPLVLATAVVALLVAGALANTRDQRTLTFDEQFRETPESVTGLQALQANFPPGQAGPVDLLVPFEVSNADNYPYLGLDLAHSVDPVGTSRDGKLALIRVTLLGSPFGPGGDTIPRLRENARKFSPQAMIGGPTAEALDSENALARDARLIIPLTLALVLVIVAVLLRSLIAPIYAVATVILSYAFALGVSALLFEATDPAMPLFTFIFLVALGVDYNVFLLTRIREARRDLAPQDAVIAGLERTGGVITSAGLILAGTFCTLLATQLESLFQVGFTVALGLLVDTFLIRIFLVPSIAVLLRSKAL
ncbi:MMPL family transporter [Solirubrobacter sp. CPCC 204708]|uniref:MMPL family transporter n=1 Tax=Solirubrobacter deserti TaxID=2282478 RepID=A0ABT4RM10_9ACTN|nr:MMPL family transporter [Solirubrobacter deserti]MBE2314455.1 MMPL family transporter [Solirubrobacter deserti]MDA0139602.1 MMPL family transporter [Solirubrobacter deserti]